MNTESFNKEACLLGWKRWFALWLMVFNCWLKVKLSHISEIKTIHSEAGTLLADSIQTYHHHSLKQADHNPDLLFRSLQNEEEWGFAWLTSTNRVSAAGPHLRYLHSQVFGIYCLTRSELWCKQCSFSCAFLLQHFILRRYYSIGRIAMEHQNKTFIRDA